MIARMCLSASRRLRQAGLGAGAALAVLLATGLPVPAQESATVATVNGTAITERDLALAAEDLGEYLAQVPEAERRQHLVDVMVNLRLLSQAAGAAGIADGDEFKARMAYQRERTLRDLYFDQKIASAVTLDEMRTVYDAAMAAVEPETEVRASHILVASKEEADAIAGQLGDGGDFAELARSHSTDPGSGPKGGDLGYFTKERMVPAFAEAAFALEPGQVSEPVETQFGWHLIKVEDRRRQEPPAFESVIDQLRQVVLRNKLGEAIETLRGDATIDIVEQPAEAAPQPDAPAATPEQPPAN